MTSINTAAMQIITSAKDKRRAIVNACETTELEEGREYVTGGAGERRKNTSILQEDEANSMDAQG